LGKGKKSNGPGLVVPRYECCAENLSKKKGKFVVFYKKKPKFVFFKEPKKQHNDRYMR